MRLVALILLSGCATSPLVTDGAVRVSVEPSTTIAPDAVHLEPGTVTVAPVVHVDPGAVQVVVPVDKAAEVLSPVVERVTRAAVADVVKANRLIGRDTTNALQVAVDRMILVAWVIACSIAALCLAAAWLALDRARGDR